LGSTFWGGAGAAQRNTGEDKIKALVVIESSKNPPSPARALASTSSARPSEKLFDDSLCAARAAEKKFQSASYIFASRLTHPKSRSQNPEVRSQKGKLEPLFLFLLFF
jgi:hypothetical protein